MSNLRFFPDNVLIRICMLLSGRLRVVNFEEGAVNFLIINNMTGKAIFLNKKNNLLA